MYKEVIYGNKPGEEKRERKKNADMLI